MLISWENILPMAVLSGVVTLAILEWYRRLKKELKLKDTIGLALVCVAGFVVWFAIFDTFSLSSLNQDLPIPFSRLARKTSVAPLPLAFSLYCTRGGPRSTLKPQKRLV